MRGTGYAISEILWWMLVAGIIGIIIGWLLRRVFGGGGRAKEIESQLSEQKDRYARISSELGDWKSKSEKLETDLDSRAAELDAANRRIGDLEGNLAGVRTELDTANSKADSLQGNITSLKGELETAQGKASSLETKVAGIADKDAEIARLSTEVAGIAGLQSSLGERDGKVADLEAQLAAKTAELGELNATHAGCSTAVDESTAKVTALEADIAARDERVSSLEGDLASRDAKLADHEAKLAATDAELNELRTAHAGCGVAAEETTGKIAGLEAGLGERDNKIAGLEAGLGERDNKIADLEGRLATATAAADKSELESRLAAAEGKAAELPARDGRIADLESRLAAAQAEASKIEAREARIAELESELAGMAAVAPAAAAPLAAAPVAAGGESADFEALAASEAEDSLGGAPARTAFGTAGADHTDDLKVISGIGPKMESLLNGFGIQSWEQLADFTESDIDKVDEALTEFPGRIRRDEWVPQAQAIVANGHQPLAKDSSSDWASGTTSLGTPGASHRDDLKVINGIGPKLEGTLNGFGIQSWEQLAALDADGVAKVDGALEEFPGRITRDAWVEQAADLVKRFPDRSQRPDRKSFLNESR